ncbi:MAG: bifunctional diaminohydroxyphosphoribosylaminopyrimidine deaminase/5-amino-6-(5-phosphoribosylamino)uracil reductase RibD [Peptococcaceae bacterium]|nr:MAG: bifunctional diaminohydroxyphosphoribosylaminopyrimidine deaminase/5-amino-6-(5-phosphoribosylamino)uracil reductase RibD [Peptococcaceae bacterium]
MQMTLDLAARARGRTSPNPMVGAVVVKDDQVIGRGYHARAGEPHAEALALRAAGEASRGATLYVNLEPCCHYGRTGPCAELVISAGVKRAVVAMKDPNPLVSGRGVERLSQAGLAVTVGVMATEAARLNEVFIKHITTELPFIIAKVAMSLDGKIAAHTGRSRWITGPAARSYGHQLRDRYDAIMVGVGTVLADDPSLTTRLPDSDGRDPVRVVLDSTARTPLGAKILAQRPAARTVIATTTGAPAGRLAALRQAGAQTLAAGDGPRVDLKELMKELGRQGITSVLIEGGAEVHGSALAAGIVDKVVWFIAPRIIGGRTAPGPVGGAGVDEPGQAVLLEQVTVNRLDSDICIEGYVAGSGFLQHLKAISKETYAL